MQCVYCTSSAAFCLHIYNFSFCRFTGELCDLEIDECSPNPCVHGTCVDKLSGFQCNCDSGYLGDVCQEINFCQPNLCQFGNCTNQVGNCMCRHIPLSDHLLLHVDVIENNLIVG